MDDNQAKPSAKLRIDAGVVAIGNIRLERDLQLGAQGLGFQGSALLTASAGLLGAPLHHPWSPPLPVARSHAV